MHESTVCMPLISTGASVKTVVYTADGQEQMSREAPSIAIKRGVASTSIDGRMRARAPLAGVGVNGRLRASITSRSDSWCRMSCALQSHTHCIECISSIPDNDGCASLNRYSSINSASTTASVKPSVRHANVDQSRHTAVSSHARNVSSASSTSSSVENQAHRMPTSLKHQHSRVPSSVSGDSIIASSTRASINMNHLLADELPAVSHTAFQSKRTRISARIDAHPVADPFTLPQASSRATHSTSHPASRKASVTSAPAASGASRPSAAATVHTARPGTASTSFARAYTIGHIPCRINHGSVKHRLQWDCDVNTLAYDPLLVLITDGLCETQHPFVFIAPAAFHDLMLVGSCMLDNTCEVEFTIAVQLKHI